MLFNEELFGFRNTGFCGIARAVRWRGISLLSRLHYGPEYGIKACHGGPEAVFALIILGHTKILLKQVQI